VVVSQVGGGLHAYLNPGEGGGAFRGATEAMGLSKEACGAGGTGFFAPGDWNDDGRTDLFYAAGGGLLLTRTAEGTFAPTPLRLEPSGSDRRTDVVVAGAFAPLWRNDSVSLLVVKDASFALIVRCGERLCNVIADTGALDSDNRSEWDQISVLCEDLDADGNVDIVVGTQKCPRFGSNSNYYCNRGYGSFIEVRCSTAFPWAFRRRTWGLADGDVNGDGANDILLGGVDGTLALLVNETLSLRKPPKKHTSYSARKRYDVTILAIDVKGPVGVTGAKLVLTDAEKRTVARRDIGNNINVGSCSSDRVNLAVREDGEYVLAVTWSDGASRNVAVTVGEQRRIPLTVERPPYRRIASPTATPTRPARASPIVTTTRPPGRTKARSSH
jgi:hypothetical protein